MSKKPFWEADATDSASVCSEYDFFWHLHAVQICQLGLRAVAVTPEFIDEMLGRITLSDLVGKRVKLVRKANRMNGLCPFHNEKTPSFYVNDSEGFYHCFGCNASGDAISFLRESEGLEFIEAVKQLASLAGMAMPQNEPIDKEAAKRRLTALELLEVAASFYQRQLDQPDGKFAFEYLEGRGLSAEMRQEFRIGYAPKSGLYASLQQREFPFDLMQRLGVVGRSDRDGSAYDYFRNRVMFPIENRQGQVIAFGARAMGDAQPKYLNSPDGPSFTKGSVVYGWSQARARVRKGLPLVIVEGYMDVIAVSASGIAGALAPLGTAMTEQQIQLVWKLHKEPILCFDGDSAGQKAAMRALERILPLLEPGRNVRFALMAEGQDPDDLLKAEGPDGLARVLAGAVSLIELLWGQKIREYGLDRPDSQPTQRAAFWADIRQMGRTIAHNQTRSAFLDDIEYRISMMRARYRQSSYGRTGIAPLAVSPKRPQTGRIIQHKAILALLIAFPELLSIYAEPVVAIQIEDERLEELKNLLISQMISDPDLDAEAIRHHLKELGYTDMLDELFSADMMARFGTPLDRVSSDKAGDMLAELLGRAS